MHTRVGRLASTHVRHIDVQNRMHASSHVCTGTLTCTHTHVHTFTCVHTHAEHKCAV